jgi:4-amino-4-deoxy-L-arabinose transferase-like glycosyltransferase
MLEISTKSPKKIALFLFLLCFVIRLAVIFTFSQEGSDTIDGLDYHNHALAILNGQYPTHGSLPFMRPPLYPLFLAGVYAIFPHDGYLTSWIFNAVIDGLTCVVFYRLIIRLFDNHLTALLSAVKNKSDRRIPQIS